MRASIASAASTSRYISADTAFSALNKKCGLSCDCSAESCACWRLASSCAVRISRSRYLRK